MWLSDRWRDYELVDCGGGERLERWGGIYLVRPDPQAIWKSERTHEKWRRPNAVYSRSNSGGGHWEKNALPEKWQISYDGLTFNIKPMNFKHTGLFPEQAANWDFIRGQIRAAQREISVLNLFAYTGAATLAAAAAGAKVCHVDAARGMVAWGRENAVSSGLRDAPIRWIVDDCVKFVQRELRRGKKYDAVIMDPPSYGRGPSGEIWKLEDELYDLVELCAEVLSGDPLFFIINSYTTGLAPSVLSYILNTVITPRHGGKADCGELGLKVSENGLEFPCGAAGRWRSASAPAE
ncbi:MAG: class I SAM-dependent methyltransferase [Oscillospiraceae bacterium]|nr:class I SAM-dependent methyltransferase [Oscillospiraceae bacterium]